MTNQRLRRFLTRLPSNKAWPDWSELEGIRVPVRQSPFPPALRRHIMRGGYERPERNLIQRFVNSGDKVLELGASSGVITSFLHRQVGPTGRVVSVEADPRLQPYFERTLAYNGFSGEWVHALCYPDWSPEPPDFFQNQRFREDENPLGGKMTDATGNDIEVPVLTAAEICAFADFTPNTLVMDIEGAEISWLKSPPQIPESIRTLVIELHPDLVGARKAGECLQTLVALEFGVRAFDGSVFALSR